MISTRSMLSRARSVLLAAGLAAALASPAAAQSEFTYQGVLSLNGSPVDGLETIRFRLFDAPTGGTLFGETTQNVDVAAGVFSAPLNLGTLNTIDPASAWLEVAVNTGPGTFDVLGRQKLTAAPFAMNTRGLRVDGIGEVTISGEDNLNGQAILNLNSGQLGSQFAAVNFFDDGVGQWGIGKRPNNDFYIGSAIRIRKDNDNVGIGTDAPANALSVNGSADFAGNVGIGTDTPVSDLAIVAPPGFDDAFSIGVDGPVGDGTSISVVQRDTVVDPSAVGFLQDIVAVSQDAQLGLISNGGGSAGSVIDLKQIDGAGLLTSNWRIGREPQVSGDLFFSNGTGEPLTRNVTFAANGNVGIGTTAPDALLDIERPSGANANLIMRSSVQAPAMQFINSFGGPLATDTWSMFLTADNRMLVRDSESGTDVVGMIGGASPRVGINTGVPSFTLEVNGTAGKPGGGSWSNSSDRRLKTNIAELDGALDTILALKGVTYEYKDAEAINELPGERIGFIAQDVEAVIPDWIDEGEDGYKRMTIRGFEALAVESFREQQAQIEALEATVESLKAERSVFTSSLAWPMVAVLGVGGIAVSRRRAAKA